jgi:hypothetical protein
VTRRAERRRYRGYVRGSSAEVLFGVCGECGFVVLGIDEHAEMTAEIADVARLSGAVDFARVVPCPKCGTDVQVRPPPPAPRPRPLTPETLAELKKTLGQ